jgi:hypothetical protein
VDLPVHFVGCLSGNEKNVVLDLRDLLFMFQVERCVRGSFSMRGLVRTSGVPALPKVTLRVRGRQDARVAGWKGGRVAGWKVAGWKGGRVEGWKG